MKKMFMLNCGMGLLLALATGCAGTRTDFVLERSPLVPASVLMNPGTKYCVVAAPTEEINRLKSEIMAYQVGKHLQGKGYTILPDDKTADLTSQRSFCNFFFRGHAAPPSAVMLR